MHRILLLLSEMLHSCLLIFKSKQTCMIFFLDTSHLCWLTEELNALTICHHITCYYSKYDAVMKMQYILFYKRDYCHAFCLDFSLLTRCYVVLTHQTFLLPWVDYWPSSCLYLLIISGHRMSEPHADFIQRSSVFHLADSWDLEIPDMLGD